VREQGSAGANARMARMNEPGIENPGG
jgi:hypothetical protein